MSHTCVETGQVTDIDSQGTLLVRLLRAEACHSCDAKGACQAFGGKTEDVELKVENTLGAAVGDEVQISLLESSVIKASAVLYLLPASGLIGGALAAAECFSFLDRDGRALIGALVGTVIGFALAKAASVNMSRDVRYKPTLTKIVSSQAPPGHTK